MEKIVVKFCEHGLNKNKVFPSTAEDISSNLRPLHLASGVRSERLFERKGVHADGDYIPSPCYLRKAYDGKPE
ncbi:hypothetical protein [Sphingomonas xinjiangensis]|uniref:Uncharacterized protein n=1 Tax=Sphingomonas xinjiangensis TaxID=643568 RepID=A0A840YA40_9SPHN|nr:hypothetical protein [Sphingomonas xinjiangensis]MBB5709165.1 hypothetical protein [Sphingomonas xinjiangensis]